jgi:hypothetical protein
MLVVEELDDGLPGVAVVDIVAKARRVDDGEADCVAWLILSRGGKGQPIKQAHP